MIWKKSLRNASPRQDNLDLNQPKSAPSLNRVDDSQFDEIDDRSLFATDGIKWELLRSKDRRKVTITAQADAPICLMALYLALDEKVEQLRRQLGVMPPAEKVQ